MKSKLFFDLHTDSQCNRKNLYLAVLSFCLLLVITLLLLYSFQTETTSKQIQKEIASEIIRFHVIANSDSTEDQTLKMKIKDALTESLRPTLKDAKSIDEARNLLISDLSNLENLSNRIIKENGFTYTASASLEHGYFPLKIYGDLSLPPGEYEAVRIELGSAVGQNWWCIVFPPLCFVNATYNIVPDSSKEQFKYLLTDEEYNSIFTHQDVKIKVKSKLLPWFKDLFKK
jgi:stage II sporulation protein R